MWIVYLRRTLYSPCNDSLPPPSACRHFGSRAFNQAQTWCERGLPEGRGLGEEFWFHFMQHFRRLSLPQVLHNAKAHTHTHCTHLLLLLLLLLRVLAKCKLRWRRRRPPVVAIIAPRQFQMKAGVSNVNFCQPTPCGGESGRGVLPK